jgi:5,10-methylenetetrahydromethanopterin reductase
MKIGIFGGDTAGRTIDDLVADARAAEVDGFASYALPQIFALDAMGVLTVVGREVPRIGLATAVVPTYGRHPITMAQQALTVQAASGGRFVLGIGLSHQLVIEGMFGLSFEKPVRHMREYLAALMPLITEGTAACEGETISAKVSVGIEPRIPCPVLVAALGEQMLKLAGTVADGTMTWMTGPATLASHTVPIISAAAERAGRPAPQIATSRYPSASPATSTRPASERHATSRSTDSCPRTAQCSTAKEPRDRPTLRLSATRPGWRSRCARWPMPESPNTSRPSSVRERSARGRGHS